VKIDVEGYEARVLDGAAGILRSAQPPFVVIETADRLADTIGESARSVLGRLLRAGYRIWRIPDVGRSLEAVPENKISPELNNYLAAHPTHSRFATVLRAVGVNPAA
jgi:hypothetical protein